MCRDCVTLRAQEIYWDNRLFANAIKMERGCADCGYSAHPAALEFDHLPGTQKRYKVSALMLSSRAVLMAEIAKCEVVCANCHAIRTRSREEKLRSVEARRRDRLVSNIDDPQLGLFG